jgi:CheY-like chemotaxis protein
MSAKPLILCVEDDPDTLRLTQTRLSSRYEVLGATNDVEACTLIKKHAANLYAILMDIELQGSALDGLMLVRLVRGLPLGRPAPSYANVPTLPHLPIMVLTAYATKYTDADVKPLGATQLLTKPIDFTRLNLALAQANIQSVMARLSTHEKPRGR